MAFEPYVDERGAYVDEREHKRREKWLSQFTPEENAERAARLEVLEARIRAAGYGRKPIVLTAEERVARAAEYAARPPKPTREWFVYFVRGETTGRIKIGRATNIGRRLSDLRGASGEGLELLGHLPESLFTEADLHARFHGDRLHREWFRPSDALMAFIKEHATNG